MGGGALSPLALANKAESVVSITSQCSFSSTIVHVGDKKPPESGMGVAEGAQNQGSIWSLSQSSLLPCLFLPSGPKWREGASILAFLTLCSPASLRHLVCPPSGPCYTGLAVSNLSISFFIVLSITDLAAVE